MAEGLDKRGFRPPSTPAPHDDVDRAESDASDRDTGVLLLRSLLLTGNHHSGQRASWVKSP